MYDPIGTYDPRPAGTAHSFGHVEDPHLLGRMLRQVYRDLIQLDEARAFHTAKRLHEQLTGSIDQASVRRLLSPPLKVHTWERHITDQEVSDRLRHGPLE